MHYQWNLIVKSFYNFVKFKLADFFVIHFSSSLTYLLESYLFCVFSFGDHRSPILMRTLYTNNKNIADSIWLMRNQLYLWEQSSYSDCIVIMCIKNKNSVARLLLFNVSFSL